MRINHRTHKTYNARLIEIMLGSANTALFDDLLLFLRNRRLLA